MLKRGILAAAVLATLGTGSAMAEQYEGWYVGASGGLASVDLDIKDFDAVAAADTPRFLANINNVFGTNITPGNTFTSTLDDSDTSWGLQVGYRFGPYVAAELGYVNFGKAIYEASTFVNAGAAGPQDIVIRTRFTSTGPTISLIGLFPITHFDFHARLGIFFSDTRIVERFQDAPGSDGFIQAAVAAAAALTPPVTIPVSVQNKGSDKDFFAGIGGTWNINEDYSLRAEYQHFFDVGTDDQTGERDIDLFTIGFLFR